MKKHLSSIIVLLTIFSSLGLAATPDFREICRGLVDKAGTASVVAGGDGWLFFKEDLQHLAAGFFWGEAAAKATRSKDVSIADPFQAIEEYNRLLAGKGITLYLMPVPPKALVYPEKLVATSDQSSTAMDVAMYGEFYKKLAASGVKVIDLLPTLLAQKTTAQLYCRTDTHFSGAGLMLFAKAAADAVQKDGGQVIASNKEFVKTAQKVTIRGDLTQMAGAAGPEEVVDLTIVTGKGDGNLLESDGKSPVILMGDSHTLVFQAGGDLYAKGAGLFDHLSAELGFPVDLLGVRGSGVTPARVKLFQRAKQDPAYLTGKKALIWCFAAREFTGSGGWRKVPVAP